MRLTTAKKVKFSINDFFSKCDRICSFLRIWSLLVKKSLMENFIFCAVCSFESRKMKISNRKICWSKEYILRLSAKKNRKKQFTSYESTYSFLTSKVSLRGHSNITWTIFNIDSRCPEITVPLWSYKFFVDP